MATITATLSGATLLVRGFQGIDNREIWLCQGDFAAATASDTVVFNDVGATLSAEAADGKTRTLRWSAAGPAGKETADGDLATFIGTDAQTHVVSSDVITGQGGNATTAAAVTAVEGVGFIVCCDLS